MVISYKYIYILVFFCPKFSQFPLPFNISLYGEDSLENQTGEVLGILVDGKFCLISLLDIGHLRGTHLKYWHVYLIKK